MKIKANDYEPDDIVRIIREWTGFTQAQFGESIHKSRHTVQSMELGRSNIYLKTLLDMAHAHGLSITIEKK